MDYGTTIPNVRRHFHQSEDIAPALRRALDEIERAAPGGIHERAIDRIASSHDASPFLLVPQAVVRPRNVDEVAALLRAASRYGIAVTFRSGGTSLSGQGVGAGLLVDVRRKFTGVEVLGGGAKVRVQPGSTLQRVNSILEPYGTRLGPDPASEAACTVGGVIANNSSGMTCGVELNTYRTLESMVLMLADGTVIDTAAPDGDDRLRSLEPDLHRGLAELRDRVRANAELVRTIQRLFAIKNTMGYGVNAFLDHDRPVDILAHLVIGSEGTLAFVTEATFRTVPRAGAAATTLAIFPDLASAADSLDVLLTTKPAVVELLDHSSLRLAQMRVVGSPTLDGLDIGAHAALLIEYQERRDSALLERTVDAQRVLATLPVALPAVLTDDRRHRANLWSLRKGLYPAVAGSRPAGSTSLLEDIAVPHPELTSACAGLAELFERFGYHEAITFGHAKDGNLHFLINERFENGHAPDRYDAFTQAMVDLVLGHGGTLKAEHGTGRAMAPFVRRQYGDELYDVMREVKRLCDPFGILNPGVLINDDPTSHMHHLKVMPTIAPDIDPCVECGYCEPICPSRDLTLTPRQRIVVQRELQLAIEADDQALRSELQEDVDYHVVQTCASDGMCMTVCPVGIDTGGLVRRLRSQGHRRLTQHAGRFAAGHWETATRAASAALSLAALVPTPVAIAATRAARKLLGDERVPAWSPDMPRGGPRRFPSLATRPAEAVYLPSCLNSLFDVPHGGIGSDVAFRNLCARAGIELVVPAGIGALCCANPWKSKGLDDGRRTMVDALQRVVVEATDMGRLPLVTDASSCAEGFCRSLEGRAITALDATTFVVREILPKLTIHRTVPTIVVHPTCAATHLGAADDLVVLASAIAHEVIVPTDWGCCAFAGDRGLLHPELTKSATAREATEIAALGRDALFASSNRTCELAMSRATGHQYQHILELVDLATR